MIDYLLASLCLICLLGYGKLSADEPIATPKSSLVSGNSNEQQFSIQKPVVLSGASDDQLHPLQSCLKLASEGYKRINRDVQDYTCTLVKRERINGKLSLPEKIFAKVRHEQLENGRSVVPFAVYMEFLAPKSKLGRKVLFVKETEDSQMLVRNGGNHFAFLTVSLNPKSRLAMTGNLYPITEFGIKRLIERMIEIGTKELAYNECEVTIRENVTFANYDRPCTCIEVTHPIERDYFTYHITKVFVDEKLRLPIRHEAYDWPVPGSDTAILKEEYTYLDLKLNVGLTAKDFEADNPDYGFR